MLWKNNPNFGASPALGVRRRASMPVALLGLFALAVVLRWVAVAVAPLIPEEAYYWMYAQHPSLSYFDHPPMVAWVIALGTRVFGDTELGVRVVNTLTMVAASLLLFDYGRIWFGRRAGLLAAVALHVLPVYFGVGFVTTMDAALILFWTLGLVGFSRAVKYGSVWGWYVAGVAVGGAMLSKYTGAFLGLGMMLATFAHRPWRRRWALSPHPYMAVLLAVAAFSPVIVWNYRHDWASFRFQFVDRYAESAFDVRHFLSFLGFQFLALTPVPLIGFGMLLWRLARRRRWRAARWWVTLCFTLPLLVVTAYKAIRYDVHMNWTLPAYLALLPALLAWMLAHLRLARRDARRWRESLRPWAWTAVVCLVVNIGLMVFAMTPAAQRVSSQMGPWRELAAIIEEHEDALEATNGGREPLIVAEGKYRLASVLAFYRTPIEAGFDASRYTTSQWLVSGEGLGFEYWVDPRSLRGIDCIYVTTGSADDVVGRLGYCFDSIEVVHDPRLKELSKRGYGMAIGRGLRIVPEPSPGLAQSTP